MKDPVKRTWSQSLQRSFVAGLILLAPMAATAYIVFNIAGFMEQHVPYGFLGGSVLTIAIILVVGLLSRTALGSALSLLGDTFGRLPVLGLVYGAVRDLVNALSGEDKRFKDPVWVRPFAGSSLKVIGFITRDDLRHLGAPGEVAVYLPSSYNISGVLVIVPRKLVKPVRTKSKDLFAFVATGGLSGAHHKPDHGKGA